MENLLEISNDETYNRGVIIGHNNYENLLKLKRSNNNIFKYDVFGSGKPMRYDKTCSLYYNGYDEMIEILKKHGYYNVGTDEYLNIEYWTK